MTTSPARWAERVRIGVQRWGLLRLRSVAGQRGPAHLATGELGELEALFYLRRQGYLIVERRWRSKEHNGDVDLIGWDGATLCFIEVKTRSRRDHTPAASAVDYAKQQMLRRMAGSYRRGIPAEQRYATLIRFDVVSVYLLQSGVECELVRNAFQLRPADTRRSGV